jgi:hypothetical protein
MDGPQARRELRMLTQDLGIDRETRDMDTPTVVLEAANVVDDRRL